MSEKQFYLLQVNDALFPIGGYSHSQGLETYIQRGIVHDADTAREYITHKIKWNLAYTELLAARLAYEAAEKKDLQELLYLEELLEASRIPMEQREAARKMGSRFAKTIEKLGLSISETGIFREYLDARKGKAVNHCCIYGVFCAEMQIPLEEALTHYLYAQTSAIVTNCVKTIPLSQTSGQQLLSGCYGEFDEILKDVMNRSEEDLCLSAPGFDIRGIQHEKLYSAITFISAISAAIAVLNFRFSMSSVTFLIVLWNAFSISGRIASPSATMFWRFQKRSINRRQPLMPALLHGAAFSKSPINISYMRIVSAPYSLTMSSGLTTLPRDLLIFSPFSPRIMPWLVRFAFNIREIAQIMDISEGAVQKRLARARGKLRQDLQESEAWT